MKPRDSVWPCGAVGGRVLGPKHRTAVISLQTRPGDRVWLTTEFGGALFTRYPIGPRPADGRLSLRIRRRHLRRPRLRSERVRGGAGLWWRARQQGRRRARPMTQRESVIGTPGHVMVGLSCPCAPE